MKIFIKRIIVFLFVFILANLIFGYLYERPIREAILNKTHSKYLQYNDIHNPNNKYDIIFLGSSRGFCAYNPQIFDSVLQTNSYNMCTGSQNIIESYYTLKEILRFQKPKIIVYEIFLPSFDKTTDYYQILSNGSFMSTEGELDLIVNGFGFEGILNYFLPLLKHKLYLKKDISNFLLRKENAVNSGIEKTKFIKGYISDSTIVDAAEIKNFEPIYSFENRPPSDKKLNHYFKLFIELCKLNKIALVCVTAPYPPSRLKKSTTDSASSYFKKTCSSYNIPFFDLNHLTNSKYEYRDSDFTDLNHMNYMGANKASKELAELLSKHLYKK